MWPWRKNLGPKEWRSAAYIVLTLGIGAVGAFLYALTPLPLPWFLGAMLAGLVALAVRVPIESSESLTLVMRIVLGLAIGSAFSPEMTDRAGQMAVSLMFIFPYILILGLIGYGYFRVFHGYDRITAFLSAMPGGLQSTVAIAEDSGADLRKLSIIHSTRIMVVVLVIPVWIQFSGSVELTRIIPAAASFAAISLKEGLILIFGGAFGFWGARRLGISGGAIIGPMLVNGAVHMAGFAEARVPVELVNLAQLAIGSQIACKFAGVTARELASTVSVAIFYVFVLLAGTGLFTFLVVSATGIDVNAVALAYAPGGQPEMNLVALVLNLDPAYVALHHLLRVMVIVFGAQFIISWIVRKEARESGQVF